MSRQEELSQWSDRLASRLPRFSKPQIQVLALWSFAIVVCRYCGLSRVALFLSTLLGQKENTIRERLRDLYRPAQKKRGEHRCELQVSRASADLLAWCAGDAKRLVVALDVTNLQDRFHVLAVSVLCRGGAVPIAWRIRKGNEPGEWTPDWKELLLQLAQALPEDVTVLVLTDRGLESRRLFEVIKAAGFHPLMRLKMASATFRPRGWKRFHPLQHFARLGHFQAEGELYKTDPLPCHLLIRHDEEHEDPWILATDLGSAKPAWYAFRSWIEQGFKDIKRGGFHWQRTRMQDPERVERMWLALALALLWTLEVGAEAESLEVGSLNPPTSRHHSLSVRGQIIILATLLAGSGLPSAQSIVFDPPPLPEDPWPEDHPPPPPLTELDFLDHQKTYT